MKTGWILQEKDGEFVDSDFGDTPEITEAHIFPTRRFARQEKDSWECVRKVELNEDGTARRIIKGR